VTVRFIELPAVKKSSPYPSGLEHAELVIGQPADGCLGTAALRRFLQAEGMSLAGVSDDEQAVNADAALGPWTVALGGEQRKVCVKLHARPIDEVVAYERANGLCLPPPADYFAGV
jgi:predicted metalloenzyme YecM